MKIVDRSYKVTCDTSGVLCKGTQIYDVTNTCKISGAVQAAEGVVAFSMYRYVTNPRQNNFTVLNFIHAGRLYGRRIPTTYTDRGLVTVARRFAEQVQRRVRQEKS